MVMLQGGGSHDSQPASAGVLNSAGRQPGKAAAALEAQVAELKAKLQQSETQNEKQKQVRCSLSCHLLCRDHI